MHSEATWDDYQKTVQAIESGNETAKNMKPSTAQIARVGAAFASLAKSDRETFAKLFRDDRHATIAGAYLAALVLAGHITNKPVTDASWSPKQISEPTAVILRKAAQSVLAAQPAPKP